MSNNDLLRNLSALVAIPSVLDEPQQGAPFGEANRDALDFILKLGKDLGFDVYDGNGYYGYIDWRGESRFATDVIGILGHLDVVPADNYKLIKRGGMLFGRGVVDNKGPVLCALESMSRLKQSGYSPKHTIRLIVGCNEEKGSNCIAKYRADNQIIPKASFTPDSDFPIVISEMGILHVKVTLRIESLLKNKITINGGKSANVVPDSCEVGINGVTHIFKGKSAHAMRPNDGKNAILTALKNFPDNYPSPIPYSLFPALSSAIFFKDDSGEQTISIGIIKTTGNTIEMTFDLRCPVTCDTDDLKSKILTAFKAIDSDAVLTTLHFAPALRIDPQSITVRSLLDAYTSVTGLPPDYIKTGGGTYARALPNTIAFGPTFPKQVTNIHQPNEQISINNLFKLIDIYSIAISNLDNNL